MAQDAETAQLMGVDVSKVISRTFIIGGLLAGVGGVLYAMFHAVNYTMGFVPGIKAFTAAVLGGIGNVRGAMLGGLLLGIVETFSQGIFKLEWVDVVSFVVLVARPADPARPASWASGRGGRRDDLDLRAVGAGPAAAQPRRLVEEPALGRLFTIFALFLVLSILTNKVQGSSSDYTLLFKSSWFSARGAQFLIGAVVIWVHRRGLAGPGPEPDRRAGRRSRSGRSRTSRP